MGTISAQIDAKRNLINRSIHRTSQLMCKQHIGTNHPQGTTGENYHTRSRCKHLGFEGEVVTTVHGRNGVEGKVPGEEEQQIRPEPEREAAGAAETAQGRQAAVQERDRRQGWKKEMNTSFTPCPGVYVRKTAPSDNPMMTWIG